MPERHLGEIFAGLTACCWVGSSICFEYAGRRIGSLVVNLLRLALASVLLGGLCLMTSGAQAMHDVTPRVLIWIAISGVLGFFICDMCLFRAFVLIGARRSMLMLSLSPVFAAMLDYAFLRDPLSRWQLAGMALTLAGVAWVILERRADEPSQTQRETRQGTLLALIAAMGQALGAASVKYAMDLGDGRQFDALTATMLRVIAGTICFALLIAALRWGRQTLDGMKDRRAMLSLSLGAVLGPVIGVTLFLASLQHTKAGVTQTILATIPVLILPVAYFQTRERIGPRAVLGAFVAVAGVIVLCLS